MNGNGKLDVEVHNGRVVAIWHNCTLLPFELFHVDDRRAADCGGNPDAAIVDRIDVVYADPPSSLPARQAAV